MKSFRSFLGKGSSSSHSPSSSPSTKEHEESLMESWKQFIATESDEVKLHIVVGKQLILDQIIKAFCSLFDSTDAQTSKETTARITKCIPEISVFGAKLSDRLLKGWTSVKNSDKILLYLCNKEDVNGGAILIQALKTILPLRCDASDCCTAGLPCLLVEILSKLLTFAATSHKEISPRDNSASVDNDDNDNDNDDNDDDANEETSRMLQAAAGDCSLLLQLLCEQPVVLDSLMKADMFTVIFCQVRNALGVGGKAVKNACTQMSMILAVCFEYAGPMQLPIAEHIREQGFLVDLAKTAGGCGASLHSEDIKTTFSILLHSLKLDPTLMKSFQQAGAYSALKTCFLELTEDQDANKELAAIECLKCIEELVFAEGANVDALQPEFCPEYGGDGGGGGPTQEEIAAMMKLPGNRVHNGHVFQLLLMLFQESKNESFRFHLLESVLTIYAAHPINPFYIQPMHPMLVLFESLDSLSPDLQVRLLKILEYVVIVVNYIPLTELKLLISKLRQPLKESSLRLIFHAVVKFIQFDSQYIDVFSIAGIMEHMALLLYESGNYYNSENDNDPPPANSEMTPGIIEEAITTIISLIRAANTNGQAFAEASGPSNLLSLASKDVLMQIALKGYSQLVLIDQPRAADHLLLFLQATQNAVFTGQLKIAKEMLATTSKVLGMRPMLRPAVADVLESLLLSLKSLGSVTGRRQQALRVEVVEAVLQTVASAVMNTAECRTKLLAFGSMFDLADTMHESGVINESSGLRVMGSLFTVAAEEDAAVAESDWSPKSPDGKVIRIYNPTPFVAIILLLRSVPQPTGEVVLRRVIKLIHASAANALALNSVDALASVCLKHRDVLRDPSSPMHALFMDLARSLCRYRLGNSDLQQLLLLMDSPAKQRHIMNFLLEIAEPSPWSVHFFELANNSNNFGKGSNSSGGNSSSSSSTSPTNNNNNNNNTTPMDLPSPSNAQQHRLNAACGCIEIPSLGERPWPPSNGWSFCTWVHSDSWEATTLFSAEIDGKNVTQVRIEKGMIVWTMASKVRVNFGFPLRPMEWHHIAVVLSRNRIQSSTATLFVNGFLTDTIKIAHIQSNNGMLRLLIGGDTIPGSSLRVGPCYVLEDPISAATAFSLYHLGPNICSHFICDIGYWFSETKFSSRFIEDYTSFAPNTAFGYSISPFIVGTFPADSVLWTSSASALLFRYNSEEDVALTTAPLYAHRVPNGADPSGNSDGFFRGDATSVVGVPLADGLRTVGGTAVVLELLERAETTECVCQVLRLLRHCLLHSKGNLAEMEIMRGYETLAALLRRKSALIDLEVLGEMFALVGFTPGEYETSVIVNAAGFEHLFFDYRLWKLVNEDIRNTAFERLVTGLCSNVNRPFNIARMRRFNAVSELLHMLGDEDFPISLVYAPVALIRLMLQKNYEARDLKAISFFTISMLPSTNIPSAILKSFYESPGALSSAPSSSHHYRRSGSSGDLNPSSSPGKARLNLKREKSFTSPKITSKMGISGSGQGGGGGGGGGVSPSMITPRMVHIRDALLRLVQSEVSRVSEDDVFDVMFHHFSFAYAFCFLQDTVQPSTAVTALRLLITFALGRPKFSSQFRQAQGFDSLRFLLRPFCNCREIYHVLFLLAVGKNSSDESLEQPLKDEDLLELCGSFEGSRVVYPEAFAIILPLLKRLSEECEDDATKSTASHMLSRGTSYNSPRSSLSSSCLSGAIMTDAAVPQKSPQSKENLRLELERLNVVLVQCLSQMVLSLDDLKDRVLKGELTDMLLDLLFADGCLRRPAVVSMLSPSPAVPVLSAEEAGILTPTSPLTNIAESLGLGGSRVNYDEEETPRMTLEELENKSACELTRSASDCSQPGGGGMDSVSSYLSPSKMESSIVCTPRDRADSGNQEYGSEQEDDAKVQQQQQQSSTTVGMASGVVTSPTVTSSAACSTTTVAATATTTGSGGPTKRRSSVMDSMRRKIKSVVEGPKGSTSTSNSNNNSNNSPGSTTSTSAATTATATATTTVGGVNNINNSSSSSIGSSTNPAMASPRSPHALSSFTVCRFGESFDDLADTASVYLHDFLDTPVAVEVLALIGSVVIYSMRSLPKSIGILQNFLDAVPSKVSNNLLVCFQSKLLLSLIRYCNKLIQQESLEDNKILRGNVASFCALAVEKVQQGTFVLGERELCEFICKVISRLDTASGPQSRPKHNSQVAVLKSLNKISNFLMTHCTNMLQLASTLEILVQHKAQVFHPANNDVEYFACMLSAVYRCIISECEAHNEIVSVLKTFLTHKSQIASSLLILKPKQADRIFLKVANQKQDYIDILHGGFDLVLNPDPILFWNWTLDAENRKVMDTVFDETIVGVAKSINQAISRKRETEKKALDLRRELKQKEKDAFFRVQGRLQSHRAERRLHLIRSVQLVENAAALLRSRETSMKMRRLEDSWTRSRDDLRREGGVLFNGDVQHDKYLWILDLSEGPCRMRKHLTRISSASVKYPPPKISASDVDDLPATTATANNASNNASNDNNNNNSSSGSVTIPTVTATTDNNNNNNINNGSASSSDQTTNVTVVIDREEPSTGDDATDNNSDDLEDVDSEAQPVEEEEVAVEGENAEAEGEDLSGFELANTTALNPYASVLDQGETIVAKFSCGRVVGLDKRSGVLLICSSHVYLLEASRLTENNEVVAADDSVDELDSIFARADAEADVGLGPKTLVWAADSLTGIVKRWYLLRRVAIELFTDNGRNHLLVFEDSKQRDVAYDKLVALRHASGVVNTLTGALLEVKGALTADTTSNWEGLRYDMMYTELSLKDMSKLWQRGRVSNFEYLMYLNTLAGRSYNDLTQYPVFPWVIAQYDSDTLDLDDPATFRDLSKPMGALNPQRAEQFKKRYAEWDESTGVPKFHYGSHYSSAGTVLHFLIRLEPFTSEFIKLQGGKFDHADRLFNSVRDAWLSASGPGNLTDVKELVPEFFYLPDFLRNVNNINFGRKQNGQLVGDVVLPRWAHGDAGEFIRLHRKALESDYVSQNLHMWIDLVFGIKQQGRAAVEAINTFYYLTYEGAVDIDNLEDPMEKAATISQINNFGQTPHQLLDKKPHAVRPTQVKGSYVYTNPELLSASIVREGSAAIGPVGALRILRENSLIASEPNRLSLGNGNRFLRWGFTDHSLRLYSSDGDRKACFEGMHDGPITAVAVEETYVAEVMATAGFDSTVKVWATRSFSKGHRPHLRRTLYAHRKPVTCLAICSAQGLLVSGDSDSGCFVWDLRRLSLTHRLTGHKGGIRCIAVSTALGTIVTCCKSSVRLWSLNGVLLAAAACDIPITAATLTEGPEWEEDNSVITGHSDGTVRIWSISYDKFNEIEGKEGRYTLKLRASHKEHETAITSIAISRDQQRIFTGDKLGFIRLWQHVKADVTRHSSIGGGGFTSPTLPARFSASQLQPTENLDAN